MKSQDPDFALKCAFDIEQDVNATIKLVMSEFEDVAVLPPEIACEPVAFNARRRRLIRAIWGTMKDCVRYGRDTTPVDGGTP